MVTGTSNNPARPPGRRRADGFTLIEVLVVVVIVGIVSAVVLLSSGLVSEDRNLRQEARRMASLIELAADEALLQGRDLGLEVLQGGYRFVEYDPYNNRWQEITGDELLRARELDEDLRLELWIEDRRVQLLDEARSTGGADAEDDDEDERYGVRRRRDERSEYAPHALIMSSGQVTPFDLEIIRDRDRRRLGVTVDPAGNIEVTSDDDDEA